MATFDNLDIKPKTMANMVDLFKTKEFNDAYVNSNELVKVKDVLDKLIRMEVVEKKAPINDENSKKKAGYYICDNLSLFYFRYIFRYSGPQELVYMRLVL